MADKMLREMEIPLEKELKQMDVAAAAQKEIAQGQAAVQEAVELAKIEADGKQADIDLKYYEIDTKAQIEREKMAAQERTATAQRAQDVDKEKAKSFGESVIKSNETAKKPAKDAGPELLELIQKMSKPKKRKLNYNANGDVESIEDLEDEVA
jgi:hypothetical protein